MEWLAVVAAEASAVGRAVLAFLKDNPGGFRGQMQHLYGRLSHYDYKGETSSRDWPKSPTRLSTELSRLSEPYGVREAGRICLTACHPNRVQARMGSSQHREPNGAN